MPPPQARGFAARGPRLRSGAPGAGTPTAHRPPNTGSTAMTQFATPRATRARSRAGVTTTCPMGLPRTEGNRGRWPSAQAAAFKVRCRRLGPPSASRPGTGIVGGSDPLAAQSAARALPESTAAVGRASCPGGLVRAERGPYRGPLATVGCFSRPSRAREFGSCGQRLRPSRVPGGGSRVCRRCLARPARGGGFGTRSVLLRPLERGLVRSRCPATEDPSSTLETQRSDTCRVADSPNRHRRRIPRALVGSDPAQQEKSATSTAPPPPPPPPPPQK